MKHKILNFVCLIGFLIGAGILSYPVVSNWWNQIQQDKIAKGYSGTVSTASEEEIQAMWEQAEAYNRNLLLDEIIIDPFDQVAVKKVKGDYENTLNPQNNGVMGTIEIPKIHVSLPIFHGTEEEVLQQAVGHLEQTSLPIGGEGTHAVLSGHRGLPSAELFTDLDQVEEGDVFYLHILDRTLAYQVDQIAVVEPDELELLAIESGKDYVTLVTCTPYSINTHRLLVRGTRIPYEEAKEEEAIAAETENGAVGWLPYAAAGLFALAVILAVLLWLSFGSGGKKRRRKKRRKKKNRGGGSRRKRKRRKPKSGGHRNQKPEAGSQVDAG